MKIGIDARFLTHPQRGGFKSYTQTVISALAEVDQTSRYILYTDRPPNPELCLPGNFKIRPVAGPHAVVREQLLLPLAMKQDRVDAAHFPCNTAPVGMGLKVVVTMHDAIPFRKPRQGAQSSSLKQRLLRSYWRAVMPKCAHAACFVIADSEYVRDDLCARFNLRPGKVRVVPLAVDPMFTGDAPGKPPADMELDSRFLLAFASADGRKNHSTSVEAYRAAAGEFPDLRLVIVCSHPGVRESIRCSPGDGVMPLGPVSSEGLLWLYRNAFALVFPSFDEGFGLPPLEAMACGTPVIASDTGSLPEIVGGCGIYVRPTSVTDMTDGIKLLLRDGKQREELAMKGRERARRFNRESMGLKLIEVYSDAVKRTRV